MDDFEFSFVPRSRHFRGNQGPSSTRITSPPIVAGRGRIWMKYDGCDVEPYKISPNIHGALESGHKFFEDFAGMTLEKKMRFLGAIYVSWTKNLGFWRFFLLPVWSSGSPQLRGR